MPANTPVPRSDDSMQASEAWADQHAQSTLWPDESGFGPYLPVSEVDVRPQPLVQIEPKFPENANPAVTGRALLLVMIGQDGLVDQVRVLASDPTDAFGVNAKAAFEQARFTPAELGGKPTATYLMIEVNFG